MSIKFGRPENGALRSGAFLTPALIAISLPRPRRTTEGHLVVDDYKQGQWPAAELVVEAFM